MMLKIFWMVKTFAMKMIKCMKKVMVYDLENYFFDIDNMRKFDDEYFYHLWDIMQDVEKELEEVEFSNNLNFSING